MDHIVSVEKKPFPFERIFWMALIIGIFIYMSKCNGGTHPNTFAEKMMKEKTADSIKSIEARKRYQDSLKDSRGQLELKDKEIAQGKSNLKIIEQTADRVIAENKRLSIPIKVDSDQYMVSEAWVKNCAECIVTLEKGNDSVKSVLKKMEEKDSLYKKDTALKGAYIAWLIKSNDDYAHQIIKWFNAYTKDTKPKSHLYAGPKISGTPTTPFNQVGGMINFLDKKGRMFTVGGGLQVQGNYFGEIGISIKIF